MASLEVPAADRTIRAHLGSRRGAEKQLPSIRDFQGFPRPRASQLPRRDAVPHIALVVLPPGGSVLHIALLVLPPDECDPEGRQSRF